jgi:hypothetical protein
VTSPDLVAGASMTHTLTIFQPFDTATITNTAQDASVTIGAAAVTQRLDMVSNNVQNGQAQITAVTVDLTAQDEASDITAIYVNDEANTLTPNGTVTQPGLAVGRT